MLSTNKLLFPHLTTFLFILSVICEQSQNSHRQHEMSPETLFMKLTGGINYICCGFYCAGLVYSFLFCVHPDSWAVVLWFTDGLCYLHLFYLTVEHSLFQQNPNQSPCMTSLLGGRGEAGLFFSLPLLTGPWKPHKDHPQRKIKLKSKIFFFNSPYSKKFYF